MCLFGIQGPPGEKGRDGAETHLIIADQLFTHLSNLTSAVLEANVIQLQGKVLALI